MKKFVKYLFVISLAFTFLMNISFAAKDTKETKKTEETKETKKETTKETKTEETKETESIKKKKKVTLYLFRRSGCSHCAEEMQFLDSIVPKYKNKLKIVVYDVTKENNNELITDVANTLKINIGGVPFNVIGSEHIEGYAETLSEEFLSVIDKVYEEQQEDVVAKLLSKKKYKNLVSTDLYEAMDEEGLEYTSKETKGDNVVIIIVFAVVIIAFGSLIYFSRK